MKKVVCTDNFFYTPHCNLNSTPDTNDNFKKNSDTVSVQKEFYTY